MGSFHHVSREHLHRYATEFSFRWNNRTITDGQRMGNGWKLPLNKPRERGLLTGNAFEGTGWLASLTFSKSIIESPDGAESEYVKRRSKKKPKPQNRDRLTLAPLKFEDTLKAMLRTQPPPTSKKAKA